MAVIGQVHGFATQLIYAGHVLATGDPRASLALTSATLLHMFALPIGLEAVTTASGNIINLADLLFKVPILVNAASVGSEVAGYVDAFYFGYDVTLGVKVDPTKVLSHYGQVLRQVIIVATGTDPLSPLSIKIRSGKHGGFLNGVLQGMRFIVR